MGPITFNAKYYVDSVAGSDSNNGLSTAAPFQTIGKLMATWASGDSVALKCGSHWREQLTLPGPNNSVGTYGGCKSDLSNAPLLDASSVISAGAWTKTGGFTNIYQATVATDNELIAFLRAWENDVGFTLATSLANLDATPSQYFSTGSGSSYTLYVHASDNSNPATNGKVYEYNQRAYGLFSSHAAIVSGITTRRNLINNGSFEVGQGSLVTDVTANEGTKHNALMHQNSTWRNIFLNNSYYAGQAKIALVLNDDSPNGGFAWIENAQYVETFETGGEGFFGHTNVSGAFGMVTLKNCGTAGAGTSIGGFNSSGMTVTGGNFNGGIVCGSTANILQNLTSGQVSIPFSVGVKLDGLTIAGSFTNGAVLVGNSITPALSVQNCDFSNSRAFDGAIYIGPGTTLSSFTSMNNIFRAPVQTNHILGPGATNLPVGSTFANNTYHYPGASSWILFRGTTYDISILSPSGFTAWLGIEPTATRVTP